MRKLMLVTAGVAMFATTGIAVARGFDDAKSATAVSGSFTATTVANSQTRSCTTTDGKTISTTNATYTGTATSTAADLTGNATFQLRSTINTTDGVGVATGKLKIAASGGDTVAQFNGVYDHGTLVGLASADLTGNATFQLRSTINTTDGVGIATGKLKIAASGGDTSVHFDGVYDHGTLVGLASGHTATPHSSLLANLSASFSATGGLTNGKLGGAAGGSAVETGAAKCSPAKQTSQTLQAHGSVTAVSTTSITVAGVTCTIPASLAGKLSSLLTVGANAEIKCSVAGGVNTLVKASAQKH